MDELEAFNERLANWRRVYGYRPAPCKSPTLVFCEYARANIKRPRETEAQKYWREQSELATREEALPPPDVADADLLNDVWTSMPERYDGVPVKKVIKTYTFGSWRDYRRLITSYGIHKSMEKDWLARCLKYFFEQVEREGSIRKVISSQNP